MSRLQGKNSGIVFDVPESIAAGLVRTGAAVRVADAATVPEPPAPASTVPEVPAVADAEGRADGGTEPQGTESALEPAPPTADADATAEGAGDPDDGKGNPVADEGRPAGNATREAWVEYALANGKTEDDLVGLKQGEIRALFTND